MFQKNYLKNLYFWSDKGLFQTFHNIKISIPTLRNELIRNNLHIVKKRKIKPQREKRERRPNYWDLIQYDWS